MSQDFPEAIQEVNVDGPGAGLAGTFHHAGFVLWLLHGNSRNSKALEGMAFAHIPLSQQTDTSANIILLHTKRTVTD
jgi:hypothetical protein